MSQKVMDSYYHTTKPVRDLDIFQRSINGESYAEIGKLYGIGVSRVGTINRRMSRIIFSKGYKSVEDASHELYSMAIRHTKNKANANRVVRILNEHNIYSREDLKLYLPGDARDARAYVNLVTSIVRNWTNVGESTTRTIVNMMKEVYVTDNLTVSNGGIK